MYLSVNMPIALLILMHVMWVFMHKSLLYPFLRWSWIDWRCIYIPYTFLSFLLICCGVILRTINMPIFRHAYYVCHCSALLPVCWANVVLVSASMDTFPQWIQHITCTSLIDFLKWPLIEWKEYGIHNLCVHLWISLMHYTFYN